jgi:hypothetical protein
VLISPNYICQYHLPRCDNNISQIDCNCDMLPLSVDDLLNYTTLMLKFCTNKPIWALLLRQVFWGWGERGRFAQKKGVMLHPQATDFREKKSSASSICIVSYCKYDTYFNKYDMYSIVGIDKKTYGEGIGITVKYKIQTKNHTPRGYEGMVQKSMPVAGPHVSTCKQNIHIANTLLHLHT